MAKKQPNKKVAAKKSASKTVKKRSILTVSNVFTEDGGNLKTLNSIPIVSIGAVFNPTSNNGAVRILFQQQSPIDFNNLSASNFAAIMALLAMPNISFNGQYLLGSK